MQLLDRYIRNNVLMAMVLVLLVLISLDLLFSLFDELQDTNDYYSAGAAISYVLHTMPRHIYELLPMSSLLGALVGLGILASSNELVVMQAAGVRVLRIVWAVMKPTAAIMLIGLVLGEYVAPAMELRGEVGKSLARGQEVMSARGGYWLKEGRQFVHVNAIEQGGILHGVSIHEYDEQQQPVSLVYARRAEYDTCQRPARWRFQGARETRFSSVRLDEAFHDQGLVSEQKTHDELLWPLGVSPELLEVLIIDPDKMAISDLYQYANFFQEQGQDASQYFLSFWKKLLQPLTTAVLVLVAISFIFGPLRESTMGSRIFVAICFGLAFIIVQRLLNTVSLVYQLDPLVAVLLPIVVSAGAGVYLLRRAA